MKYSNNSNCIKNEGTNKTTDELEKGVKMNIKQKIAIGVIAGATVVTGLYGISQVSAATPTTEFSPMVQKIVEKFNLNQDEVKAILDEGRTERRTERENEYKEKLTSLVSEGKITEAQKEAILAKHEELQKKREEYRTLDRAEKREKMKSTRDEMKKFLEEQGVDETEISMFGGPRGGGMKTGFGGGMRQGR